MAKPPESPGPAFRLNRLGGFRYLLRHVERTLGAGILVLLPIGITVLVFKFFFDLLDPVLKRPIGYLPGPEIPGIGFAALVFLVYLAGLVAAFVLGRRLIGLIHRILEVIPLVKTIYGTTRSAVELLSSNHTSRFSSVVLVEFPRPGSQAIGLVTSTLINNHGVETLAVYVPTTPLPSSGFLIMVPSSDVTPTDMSVDDAMKVIISGGILAGTLLQQTDLGRQEITSSG